MPVPTVTSILLTGTPSETAPSVIFAVTFSEAVTGVDAADFETVGTAAAGTTIATVAGGGATYFVTVGNVTAAGDLKLTLKSGTTGILSVSDGQEITLGHTDGAILYRGTAADEAITGTGVAEWLFGADGNDTLEGGDGNDLLRGGTGADSLAGGLGNDNMRGDAGNDTIDGGTGTDFASYFYDGIQDVTTGIEVDMAHAGVAGPVTVTGYHGDQDVLIDVERIGLTGTGGNDTLKGGQNGGQIFGNGGDDIIIGGNGDDVLAGGAGQNTVTGASGNDTFSAHSLGHQIITDFVSGTDRIDLSGTGITDISLVTQTPDGGDLVITAQDVPGLRITVKGRTADLAPSDFVAAVPSTVGEALFGGAGNDSINGLGGDDFIIGNGGDDTLLGSAGNDLLDGGAGLNTLDGGSGNDTLQASFNGQSVVKNFVVGQDRIGLTGLGFTVFDNNHLIQTVTGGNLEITSPVFPAMKVTVEGLGAELSAGDFVLTVPDGGNNFIGGSKVGDNLHGQGGDDTIHGREGNDTLSGGAGNDVVDGQEGNDYLFGGLGQAGNDRLLGGIGADIVSYDFNNGSTTPVLFTSNHRNANGNGLQGDNQGGMDTLESIEEVHIFGANGDDTLIGDAARNFIQGNGGNDTLRGNGGQDTFAYNLAGNGVDRILDLGAGDNIHFLSAITFGGTKAAAGTGANVGQGQVEVTTGGGITKLYVGTDATAGADVIIEIEGEYQADNFSLSPQNIFFNPSETWAGGPGADSKAGTEGHDNLQGNGGDDTIEGLAGNDFADGGDGNDQIDGGDGDDFLDGGAGANTLTGGAGADTIAASFNGQHTVIGFNPGVDKIHLGGLGFTNVGPVSRVVSGGNLEITSTVSPNFRITLVGRGADIADSDFVLTPVDNNDNFLGGGNSPDTLDGQGGNDQIHGRGGDDHLNGNAGNDTVEGHDGNDVLQGGPGQDKVFGGLGNDYILAGDFNDGNDTLDGGPGGNDIVNYNFGDRTVGFTFTIGNGTVQDDGNGGTDTLAEIEEIQVQGGSGGDTLVGNAARNFIEGRGGNDTLTGGGGNDTFSYQPTGNGTDRITDLSPRDSFFIHGASFAVGTAAAGTGAGLGQNQVHVDKGAGITTLHIGTDTIAGADITIELTGEFEAQHFKLNGNDIFYDPSEFWTGTAGDDIKTGTAGFDHLEGGAGNDSIAGLGGNDFIRGDEGNDTLDGGIGDDTLDGGPGDNSLTGGAGNDVFQLPFAGTTVVTDFQPGDKVGLQSVGVLTTYSITRTPDGTDLVVSSDAFPNGKLILQGVTSLTNAEILVRQADPSNTYDEYLNGGNGNDFIDGLGGKDFIFGRGGDDNLRGSDGNDSLSGETGDDNLGGGAGDDTLRGAEGNDYLAGGAGNDLIDGGPGTNDVSQYDFGNETNPVSFTVAAADAGGNSTQAGSQGTDVLQGIESVHVFGGSAGDVLTGDARFTFLQGNGGNDTLAGGAGGDSFTFLTDAPQGIDRVIDFGSGDNVTFHRPGGSSFTLNTTILSGDDTSGLAAGRAMVGTPQTVGGTTVTKLYVNTGEGAGIVTVELAGAVTAGDFKVYNDKYGARLQTETINFNGTAGNESQSGTLGDDFLSGNDGDDTLSGAAGNDNLLGGDGNDRLTGGAGNDRLDGGPGDNTLTGGDGADIFQLPHSNVTIVTDFQHGQDRISLESAGLVTAAGVIQTVVGSTVEITSESFNGKLVLQGTTTLVATADILPRPIDPSNAYQEFLTGNNQPNTIDGLGGNDNISGRAGDDFLSGSAGDDTLNGEAGNDNLQGGAGTDTVSGGDGNDVLGGADDNDSLTGGIGNDSLSGGTGTDSLSGGDGNDNLSGDDDNDVLAGDGGNDNLNGGAGNDTLDAGDGNDNLNGGDGADLLLGGAGNDYGVGGAGDDTVNGGAGIHDTAAFRYTGTATAINFTVAADDGNGNSTQAAGSLGVDVLLGVESVHVFGSDAADTITGDGRHNYLHGGQGNDTLTGGGSGDSFAFHTNEAAGTDRITDFGFGDDLTFHRPSGASFALSTTILSGDDTSLLPVGSAMVGAPATVGGTLVTRVYVNTGDSAGIIQVQLAGSYGVSDFTVFNDGYGARLRNAAVQTQGTAGNDTLGGGTGNDTLEGFAGNDRMFGNGGGDSLSGGDGNDLLVGDLTDSGVDSAGSGPDTIDGGLGNDILRGGSGNDSLTGGDGDDNLRGDLGNDTLDGGDGQDFAAYRFDNIGATSGFVFDGSGFGGAGTFTVDDKRGGTDTITSIERLVLFGSSFGDSFSGGTGADQLTGEGGNDSLSGGDGDDVLNGGAGNDTITGGGGHDQLRYVLDGATATLVIDLSNATGASVSVADGQGGTDVLDGIETFLVLAGSGNDIVRGSLGGDAIGGGGGNDSLSGGLGSDTIEGNDGADTLAGGGGIDTLSGNAGADTFVLDGTEIDQVTDFTAGTDLIDLRALGVRTLAGITQTVAGTTLQIRSVATVGGVDLAGVTAPLAQGSFIFATATAGNDVLAGGEGYDNIGGGGGNDTILGGGGNDDLFGNAGADSISGGAGSDAIRGDDNTSGNSNPNDGPDTLDGGDGDDFLRGSGGNDLLLGGLGNDNLRGDAGNDTLDGGAGDDFVSIFHSGIETRTTPVNIDASAVGTMANVTLTGVHGDTDVLINVEAVGLNGGAAGDTLTGGTGNDNLFGYGGDDSLVGNAGDDVILGGGGNDTLTGGGGKDSFALVAEVGRAVTITDMAAGEYVEFEGVELSGVIAAGTGAATARGAVDVAIDGGGATLHIGLDSVAGADFTVRLNGFTNLAGIAVATEDAILLLPGTGETLGNDNAETLVGGTGDDLILGLGGDDTIPGGAGNDMLIGGLGQDTVEGAGGDDLLSGLDGNDVLRGGDGADDVTGGGGDDLLEGGLGGDELTGGSGADTLDGGDGNDELEGGGGVDRFVLGATGNERIVDFGVAETIQVAGTTLQGDIAQNNGATLGLGQVAAEFDQTGATVRIGTDATAGSDVTLRLDGVTSVTELGITAQGALTRLVTPGGPGNDTVTGSDGADTLDGLGGNDLLLGLGGNDQLLGGVGNDSLSGGDGNDNLSGGSDNDTLDGGAGNDIVAGGLGNDTLTGGAGADGFFIAGGQGLDRITDMEAGETINVGAAILRGQATAGDGSAVGAGQVQVSASGGVTTLHIGLDAAAGADLRVELAGTFQAGQIGIINSSTLQLGVAQTLTGTAGADTLSGGAAADVITGDAAGDSLSGGASADSISGGAGGDTLSGGRGSDTLDGGADFDIARYDFGQEQAGVAATVTGGAVVDSLGDTDQLVGIESVQMFGGTGADTFRGGAGGDFLFGGAGNDVLTGGAGADSFGYGGGSNGTDRITDFGTGDTIRIFGAGALSGTLEAGTGAGLTKGQARFQVANNVTTLFIGTDSVAGADVTIELAGTFAAGDFKFSNNGDELIATASVNSTLAGTIGNDTLAGGLGNDTLSGLEGNDNLSGLEGADSLSGGVGNDFLVGGLGNDTIDGGAGDQDTARFDLARSAVTILANADRSAFTATSSAGTDVLTGVEGAGFTDGFERLVAQRFTITGGEAWEGTDLFGDSISAGAGNDFLRGGAGNDTLLGNAGGDGFLGGAGDDSIVGGAEGASSSGALIDVVQYTGARGGYDIQRTAEGVFEITDIDTTNGNDGKDTVTGVEGASFSDTFVRLRPQTFSNADGSVFVQGTEYAESMSGGAGNDFIRPEGGTDTVNAGAGEDTVYFDVADSAATFARIDLAANIVEVTIGGATTRLVGAEMVSFKGGGFARLTQREFVNADGSYWEGGRFADTISAAAGNDFLSGGSGDDSLFGGAGGDGLQGGTGNDTLNGGADGKSGVFDRVDVAQYKGVAANYVITPTGGGTFTIEDTVAGAGNEGKDTLIDVEGAFFADGFVRLKAMTFTNPDSSLYVEGTRFNDTLDGGAQNDFVNAGAGNDTVAAGLGNDFVNGQDGADSVVAGDGGDFIYGGRGNDTIDGGAGNDVVGFEGDYATFTLTRAGANATVQDNSNQDGDEGTDSLTGIEAISFKNAYVSLNADNALAISARDGNDSLAAGAGNDFIFGGLGNDTIDGAGGNDHLAIDANRANVTLTVDGPDFLLTNSVTGEVDRVRNVESISFRDGFLRLAPEIFTDPNGNRSIQGSILADAGGTALQGGTGNDYLDGDLGADSLSGGTGGDFLVGGDGNDTIDGGGDGTSGGFALYDGARYRGAEGSYMIVKNGDGSFTVTDTNGTNDGGNDGIDTVTGVEFLHFAGSTLRVAPLTFANAGRLSVDGTKFAEALAGGAGNDFIATRGGDDTVDGGGGDDFVFIETSIANASFAETGGTVTVTIGGGSPATVKLTNVERVGFTDGGVDLATRSFPVAGGTQYFGTEIAGDSIDGGTGNDLLIGFGGADTLAGAGGNDLLEGGAGADKLDGGAGTADIARYGGNFADYTITKMGGVVTVVDNSTADGTDTLENVEALQFKDSFHRIAVETKDRGSGGRDIYGTVIGEDIDGTVFDDGIVARQGNDTVDGGAGGDYIDGEEGDDSILGGGDGDDLRGGAGADSIEGGTGGDTITGGAGNDTMTGGDGEDLFIFVTGSGNDRIVGFDTSDDSLDFLRLSGAGVTPSDTTLGGTAGLLLTAASGETVFLVGLNTATHFAAITFITTP
ncbi:MAG TPA: hypothetical protein VED40_01300 [Azospirillaceae bacterium]|nr:hypothetical protein [Azospirillaceae bacterium]